MIALLFIITVVTIFLRIPLGAGMYLACLIVILMEGLPLELIPLRTFEALLPFPILAVPLYYIAAVMCNLTSITERVMDIARALVGRTRAGLAHVVVVASMLFSGVSGSSVADTMAVGSVMIPQMTKAGYPKYFSVALIGTSTTLGNIIPPSILMVVYGAFGSVSIGMLFLGGFIPGIIFGASMMLTTYFVSKKTGIGAQDMGGEKVKLLPALGRGWAPMLVPVLIIGGIVGGIFTPTEAAAGSIVYVLILGIALREMKMGKIAELLVESGKFIGLVMIMLSASAVFGWLLTYYHFPDLVVSTFDTYGVGYYGVFFSVLILFIVLGMIMETVPAIIMFLPTIQALSNSAGIHPVHMGLVVVMTCAMGVAVPPNGVCVLVAAKIAGIHPRGAQLMTSLYCAVGVLTIVLCILWPDVTLILPKIFMSKYFEIH